MLDRLSVVAAMITIMNETQAATTTATTATHCTNCRRKTQHRETRLDRVCLTCCWRTAKGWAL